jgi:hypothetical protein
MIRKVVSNLSITSGPTGRRELNPQWHLDGPYMLTEADIISIIGGPTPAHFTT